MDDNEEWFLEYDVRVQDAAASLYQLYAQNLRRWFELIDEHPVFGPFTANLQSMADFAAWYQHAESHMGSFNGDETFAFPDDSVERLSILLSLHRQFASDVIPAFDFMHSFLFEEGDFNHLTRRAATQLLNPLSRDLRREFRKLIRGGVDEERIVTLDHTNPQYKELMAALHRLETALRAINDYPAPDQQERHVAEVSAGTDLLRSNSVRIGAVWHVLRPPLQWIIKHFADKELGTLADTVLKFILNLFGGS